MLKFLAFSLIFLTASPAYDDEVAVDLPQGMMMLAPAAPEIEPTSAPYYNVTLGIGSVIEGQIWRSTIVGALAANYLEEAERCDVFGSGAMRFARFCQRDTAIGSLALQWLGQQPSLLAGYYHEFFNPTLPTDSSWDWGGLETNNPGVRTKIAAVTGAADTDAIRGNVAVGRDSLLHLIEGIF